MSNTGYRPDIDGLRAIAVLAVVLFHAGVFPFHSGFVGVDIFFVISGYLISSQIINEVENGHFSFSEFYARRARRIVPALVAVILFVAAVGWALTSADEYRRIASTALSSVFAYSNVLFLLQQGYFEPKAELSPLLMTWSLGVEEQFYFLFPFLILGLMRFFERDLFLFIALTVFGSFFISLYSTWMAPDIAFYMLPTRAWELGVGTLLALVMSDKKELLDKWLYLFTPVAENIISVICLLVVAFSIFAFNQSSEFPGFIALMPVLGTAGLIATQKSFINQRILSFKPLVFIGLISYSWYLWHWPILSYIRVISVATPPVSLMFASCILSFGIAILSWKFIETPFRTHKLSTKCTLIGASLILCMVGAGAYIIKEANGLPDRQSNNVRKIEETIARGRGEVCLAKFRESAPYLTENCVSIEKGHSNIAIIGDSHAAALGPALKKYTKESHRGVAILTKSSCGPLLQTTMHKKNMPSFADICSKFMQRSFDFVVNNQDIDTVILTGYWTSYNYLGYQGFYAGLTTSIQKLKDAGKRVIILGDVPLFKIDPIHAVMAQEIGVRGILANELWHEDSKFPDNGSSSMIENPDALISEALLKISKRPDVEFYVLKNSVCNGDQCFFKKDDKLLYFDVQHLSEYGADEVLKDLPFSK